MNILGIETSCDESACAIYNETQGIVAHQIHSQIKLHQQYGGVVPELASRDHLKKLMPLIERSLAEANLTPNEIDGIAYTQGPGLIGALMVGSAIAKSLAFAWNKPSIGVHHMEAHLMAVMLSENKPEFPFVALLVSGGHTQLVEVQQFGEYRLLGDSVDDAVGEAFDKTAKLLGLPYPGGPELERLALEVNNFQNDGGLQEGEIRSPPWALGANSLRGSDKNKKGIFASNAKFLFPRPMLHSGDLNFSFSGLKTHAAQVIREHPEDKANIAHAFQEAVVEVLVKKCRLALEQTGLKRLVVVGGVSANKRLRAALGACGDVYFPEMQYCTDNGAMVAYTGYLYFKHGRHENNSIDAKARWSLEEL